MFKPFKPPLPRSSFKTNSQSTVDEKILESPPRSSNTKPLIHSVPGNSSIDSTSSSGVPTLGTYERSPKNLEKAKVFSEAPEGYYLVCDRRNFTTKKHKTWDGDGVLSIFDGFARLQDISGREMGKVTYKDPLLPGSTLSVGGKDVEVDSIITKEDFMAKKMFIQSSAKRKSVPSDESGSVSKRVCAPLKLSRVQIQPITKQEKEIKTEIPAKSFYAHKNQGTAVRAGFKSPLLLAKNASRGPATSSTPRHDPNAPGAVVMKIPKDVPKGKEIVDVVLDPFLSQHLREHQKEGVKFLYECVMGMRGFNGNGAILADEMGLGKSLTTIALLWTLLKQSPFCGTARVIEKALIVCPVTLIRNWKKEFLKWLGNERIGVFVTDGQKNKITDFTHGKSYSVMIIGYEKLRSVQEELKKGCGIDIVIADEGHRLKTAQNKSAQAIRSLSTPMKIILSGTPIQNDLSEFFEMVDFVNPGLLGTYKAFAKEFETPILKSRQPGASRKDIEKGTAQQEELSALTQTFILRRTSEILSKYLPPRTEYVIFCKPTQVQVQVYQQVLAYPSFGNFLGSSESSLQLITLLKKVCNAPSLLAIKKQDSSANSTVSELLETIPTKLVNLTPLKASGKFRVLGQFLDQLSRYTSEKIVLVSNYTSTLDLLGQHLTSQNLSFLRLDGQTPTSKRQDLVDRFNRTSASKCFAFLLSAKSGGAGLNLIGASRLVLFDFDWNPATDLQAMARIHRDGQKRPVKIYRFILSGGIDEKIYQRQITKMGLADSVVDGKKNESSFSAQELRDLFRLDLNPGCQTHDLLGCDCRGHGNDQSHSYNSDETSEAEDISIMSEESESDLVYPLRPEIVAGTKSNVEAIEKRLADKNSNRLKKAKKIQALMRYRHVDAALYQRAALTPDLEDKNFEELKHILEDDVLENIMKERDTKVAYVFIKKDRV
ncbi:DNA repair and recombination protein RAD54B [Golovinomyces cichoracearum]|uniref:DNA repair and recombination protein RAD54B n=1 Tax=Golovinomyces cichoracearum TaxID=62708 RepID=A0A420I0V7_9PEZI|nr:DNA repair and recombination protein RAD54B [Golovinomyces cichoracearum]